MTIASTDPTATGSATGTPTSSTDNTNQSSGTGANSTLSATQINQLSNPQLFLQLLIAELQNQDPTNPMDPSTILQQTSELSNVEAVNSMTAAMSSEQATGLLGRTVTATVNGAPLTGTVSAINLASGTPTLTVAGATDPIALSDITQVAS